MRWRSSLAYLLVLLLVGGYYYFFEVVQKREKELAAKEAKKVFSFQPDSVNALSIKANDQATIQLKKDAQWQLSEPIKTEADRFAVQDLIAALSRLDIEREILAAPDSLKPFGLQEPSLIIRFRVGETEQGLLLGDRNPAGDGAYAKTADQTRVFLLAEGNRSALNKGLNDLRRRQLFTFQLDEVVGVNLAWRDGNNSMLSLTSPENEWIVPANRQLRIKKSKVDNLIEQVHWLRAQSFLENEPRNLTAHGLEPPFVTVTLHLKSGENAELRLAGKEKEAKQVAALSSQMPAVVQVAASIMDDLPKDLDALQDRSLLGFKPEEAQEVSWDLSGSRSRVVHLEEDKWGLDRGSKQPEPIKEGWHVKSLLLDLGDVEYLQKLDPVPPTPLNPYCRIEVRNAEKNLLVALSWDKPPEQGRTPFPVWLERQGETEAVSVEAEALRRVVGDLERLTGMEAKE